MLQVVWIRRAPYRNHKNNREKISRSYTNNCKQKINLRTSFLNLLILQLKISDKYSKDMCVICNYQLTNYCQFKKNVIHSQANLYKFSKENRRQLNQEVYEVYFIKQEGNIKEEFDSELLMKSDSNESSDLDINFRDNLKQETDLEKKDILEDVVTTFENHLANVEKRKDSGKTG